MRSCCAHLVIIVVFHLSFFLCPLTHGQTAPPNDMVTNAILISGASVSVTGSNVGATRESWETSHTYRGAKTVWWRWTAPATGKVIVDTKGSDFDTRLNVYSGQIYPQGSVTQDLSTMDDDGTNLTSLCGFNAYTNVSYFIAVDGFVLGSNPPETAASGSIVLNLKMGLPAPVFTEEPQSRVVLPGSNVTFRAAVRTSGSFSTSYYPQWLRGGIPIPGATSLSLTITNAQIADADTYSIVVTNSTGTVTRADADLVVADLFITKQPRSQRVALGYSAAFTVEALSASTGLSYQWQKDGKDLPGATGSSYSISCVQEGDFGEYCAVVSSTTSSVTTSNALLSVSYPLTIGTFAGRARARGHADGSIFTARFDWPTGIARDGAGNFYVSDYIGQTIRKITPEGIVTTLAGLAGVAGTNDGLGVAARFRNPEGLALDSATNLYVADNFNHTIRKITPDGVVATLAGSPGRDGYQNGPGSTALFLQPSGIAVDKADNIYVTEWGNGLVRKVTREG
ncbi:MAG TPA: hypothetical protein VEC99_14060, partial [Clostridia bacterium]|nr:hypothetical protein [Clostridia bacterium]